MVYRNISDVVKFVADEIAGGRKRNISFSITSDKPVISDFLLQVIEYCPHLLMCIKKFSYQLQDLGLILEYRLNIDYTNVMPACVTCVMDKSEFEQSALSSALLHRRELFFVFKKELYDELLGVSKTFTKDGNFLACYLQGVGCEIKKIQSCSYAGLYMKLSYSYSYKEYRLRTTDLNRTLIDIIHEAKQTGIEDWKKAYYVVCYCVNNWEYGNLTGNPGVEFTAYGAVVKRKAVCMGFHLLCA